MKYCIVKSAIKSDLKGRSLGEIVDETQYLKTESEDMRIKNQLVSERLKELKDEDEQKLVPIQKTAKYY